MVERFRHLFARFQNLNLITLLENLRADRVAFGMWVTPTQTMCPLNHGLSRGSGEKMPCGYAGQLQFRDDYGVKFRDIVSFIWWWDGAIRRGSLQVVRRIELIGMLESILAERRADADAAQAVMSTTQALEPVGA